MKQLSKLSLLFLLSGSFTCFAKPLSPEEALSRAKSFQFLSETRSSGNSWDLKFSLKEDSKQPTIYVFTRKGSEGFVILSGDDAARPVLGYSDQGTFDPADIPPQLEYWLKEYGRQIDFLRNENCQSVNTRSEDSFASMTPIEPMLKSKWNQGAPYNTYCYTIAANGDETKSVTGCVATSMAQVMYYYKYPEIGHGSISYKHGDSGTYSMNFGEQAFAWDEMLPTYYPDSYTAEEGDAVAYLMKACGYSVKMDYSKGDAGANGASIAGALINYFGYADGIQVQTRDFYTYNDWMTMIYDNLKNVGPLVYDGSALDGGHSFVCDGYDGNGYFHFNWGWGGMSDGYYLLDALNPDEFGIGGAAGGYNLGQQVILNISPKNSETAIPQFMQFGNATGKISGSVLSLALEDADDPGLQYINPLDIEVTFGIKVINESNPSQEIQYFESSKKNLKAEQGSFFKWEESGTTVDMSEVNMTKGDEYQFIISTYISGIDNPGWSEVVSMPGKANYVTVTKTEEGYELNNSTVGNLSVSDFEILSSPVYYDMPVKFSAQFTNDSDQQLTRNYSAVFFNSEGKECYKMENYSINVNGGETTAESWTSVNWYKEAAAEDITEDTEFTVKLYDNWQGEYVEGVELKVIVEPEAAEAKVESELTIVNGKKQGDVYVVEGNELQVSLSVKVLEGFFNHTLMLAIQAPLSDGDYFTIMHKHFDAIPDLAEGEEQVFDMSVNFEDAQEGKIYRIEVWGPGSGFNETKLVSFNLDNTGISTIQADSSGEYNVYNVNGLLMYSGSDRQALENLPKGIYIINGRKIAL